MARVSLELSIQPGMIEVFVRLKAVEAQITLYFEDTQGNVSQKIEARAWFANTDKIIIGFQDILDRATLYADFRQSHTGWIEI